MSPRYSIGNHAHGSEAAFERLSNGLDRFTARSPLEYLKNLGIRQFVATMRGAFLRDFTKNVVGVLDVLGVGHVFKIRDMIVGWISVFVIYGKTVRGADEGRSYDSVSLMMACLPVFGECYPGISEANDFISDDPSTSVGKGSSHISKLVDFIESFVAYNRSPIVHGIQCSPFLCAIERVNS